MKIVFIADFFHEHVPGGAEAADTVLIKWLLEQDHEVATVLSSHVTPELVKKHSGSNFIVANFVALSEASKHCLMQEKYVIYEHDHKYLRIRDPSPFPDFLAPEYQIINKEFYQKALSVICLSKVHEECVVKNLGISNTVNIGTSLWAEEDLDYLESIIKDEEDRTDQPCAIAWNNPIKGFPEAKRYLEGIEGRIIERTDWRSLMETMSQYQSFIFFPKVLETFSRITTEARMLGLGLITHSLPGKPGWKIGAMSEDDVRTKKGLPLIEEMKRRVRRALPKFVEPFEQTKKQENGDITVILTCYRRPHILPAQIKAIKEQTIGAKEIWLVVNDHEDNRRWQEKNGFESLGFDKVWHMPDNYGPGARFIIANFATTKFVHLLDDDTIPGRKWHKNCLTTAQDHPESILGGVGIRMHERSRYRPNTRIGWPSKNEQAMEVDLVGHSWFFETRWARYFLDSKPEMMNGEDIHFAAMAEMQGAVDCVVPPHPVNDPAMHSSLKPFELGVDNVAMSNPANHSPFYASRDELVQKYVKWGWNIGCLYGWGED
jgi:hypothetical protein